MVGGFMPVDPAIERALRINRTWFVRGGLAEDTQRYLTLLEKERPEALARACARAVQAASAASARGMDPKPDFYAAIFLEASEEEKEVFLKDHLFTRTRLESFSR